MIDDRAMSRNLALIPWHELLVRTNPWIAVFVLFTRARFDLDGAIQLAGIYYLAVVVFEVPSGWLSDRLGRVPTLRLAAVAWVGSFTCFLVGDDTFWVIAAGQALLALGYASLSGTDVTFHYDTLEAMGRADEYADRQARVSSRGLVSGAAGALAGGAAGLLDLRWAFAMSALLAAVQLALAFRFAEPPRLDHAERIDAQLRSCLAYLRHVPTAWVFGYGVAMVVLEHVAFTLIQPWITEVLDRSPTELGSAPLVAGVTVAVTALVGAAFARSSAVMGRVMGIRLALVALGALSAVIVTAMAMSTHVIIFVFIALRSAQGSAAPVLISAAVAPVVAQRHRATFLSLDSLGGRLSYGGLLLLISTDVTDDVSRALWQLATVAWVLVAITFISALAVRRRHGPAHLAPALVSERAEGQT